MVILLFFFKINYTENGFRNVQFHVNGNISCYTPVEIRRIKETVAAIVGCKLTEIDVNGYRHSSSFLAVLSIEKKYVRKLLTMKQEEKDKLSRLNIDYFIVDFITVYLQSPKGTQCYYDMFMSDVFNAYFQQIINLFRFKLDYR